MIDLANARGGPDNITVVTARFDGEGLPEADGVDDRESHAAGWEAREQPGHHHLERADRFGAAGELGAQVVRRNARDDSSLAFTFANTVEYVRRAIATGLPVDVPGSTINRLCGSGFQAFVTAAELMLNDPNKFTVQIGIQSIVGAQNINWSVLLGASVISGRADRRTGCRRWSSPASSPTTERRWSFAGRSPRRVSGSTRGGRG